MKGFVYLSLLTALVLPLFFPAAGFCTAEYAAMTGKACEACHADPAGGGMLTGEGAAFRDTLGARGHYRMLNPVQHVVRFIVGFLHMMTAIIWFGTILYVHVVLKPAYAAQGLPKSELRLGWISIIVMAVTGTLLTFARVPAWEMLLNTRFGILLTIKVALFLVMVSTAVFVTFVVGPKLRKKREAAAVGRKEEMTAEELAQFNGSEGRPVYVAYKGLIYDVSGSRLWKEGSHFKKHPAGRDMTDVLKQAPHGEDKILKMPVVGRLIAGGPQAKPPRLKAFYFMAYMNLFLVFAIVFVISLWRWW